MIWLCNCQPWSNMLITAMFAKYQVEAGQYIYQLYKHMCCRSTPVSRTIYSKHNLIEIE